MPSGVSAALLPAVLPTLLPTLLHGLLLARQRCYKTFAHVGPRSIGVPLVGMMVLLVCAAMVVGRGAACTGRKR
jgi:hypothetical protein